MLLLLAVDFIFGYFLHTYYANDLLDPATAGFWIQLVNYIAITGIMLINKWVLPWSWSDLGMAKPQSWWQTLAVTLAIFIAVYLFGRFIQPHIIAQFGAHQGIGFLDVVKGNFPVLIASLLLTWFTAAFLEEVIFRAFFINSLDLLLGENSWSLVGALLLSSLAFGGIHAYQGITGILITSSLGLIFGVAFLLNGRRIWPLVIIHGLIDTLTLISVYNS